MGTVYDWANALRRWWSCNGLNTLQSFCVAQAPGGSRIQSPSKHENSSKPGTTGGFTGSIYSLLESPDGIPAKHVGKNTYHQVTWILVTDQTRETGELEDRAANY